MSETVRAEQDFISELKGAPRIMKHGDIAVINRNELVFAPFVRSTQEWYTVWGIRKYLLHKNKWIRFIAYPKKFISSHHVIEYNASNHKLYFYSQQAEGEQITVLDLKSKKFRKVSTNYPRRDLSLSPCISNVNHSEIHILSSEFSSGISKHCVWNDQQLAFKRLPQNFPKTVQAAVMLYVPKKAAILVFRTTEIWIYRRTRRQQECDWRVLLDAESGLPIRPQLTELSAVLTCDQKHVILKGKKLAPTANAGYLKVLDIAYGADVECDREYSLREKRIRIQSLGTSFVWKAGNQRLDELLVIAYISRLFRCDAQFCNAIATTTTANLRMPPVYIMKYIAQWYAQEQIHWVAKKIRNRDKTRVHYTMPINYILKLTR